MNKSIIISRNNSLRIGLRELTAGLKSEGSNSYMLLFKTVKKHIGYRARGHDNVFSYWSRNINKLVKKSIEETSTYKEARERLLILISQIIIDYKDSTEHEYFMTKKSNRDNTWVKKTK